MSYTPQTWVDGQTGGTPLNAARLGHIETGIVDAHDELAAVGAAIATKANSSALGDLGDLTTVSTASLVAAVNEVLADSRAGEPWEFRPETYGAVGDGSTNDAAAIRAAVNAAVAYAQANDHYAEVVFRPVTYLVGGALQQGGAAHANALIPLPYLDPTTGQKVTLVLRGSREQTALPHWSQTVPQRSGAFLKTTVAGSNDATFGEASVIGSATPRQGYGGGTDPEWNNMLVVLDGVSVQAPNSPAVCGFDFRSLAEAKIISASAMVDATPVATTVPADDDWTFGLAMPIGNNNALSDVLAWSCEGFGAGLAIGEHTIVFSARMVYCGTGVRLLNGTGAVHASHAVHLLVEACNAALMCESSQPFRFSCDLLDLESSWTIWDGNNCIIGTIYVNTISATPELPTNDELDSFMGASNTGRLIRLYHRNILSGALTSTPAVPASTTALRNQCMRDVAVTVSGGTVTAISVDGVSLGITSGTVIVPAGKAIALTYSSAPSWKWVAL